MNGTQTITGIKTFDNIIKINQDHPAYIHFKTANPSTTTPDWIYFGDRIIVEYGSQSPDEINLPKKSGTIALTSDIPSVSGFASLDGDQTFTGYNTFNYGVLIEGEGGLGIQIAGNSTASGYGD